MKTLMVIVKYYQINLIPESQTVLSGVEILIQFGL